MNKIRISNDWWITLTMGVVLLIMIRLGFLINMRINEIHRIISSDK